MITKSLLNEMKFMGISEKCYEGLRTIANWCKHNPCITPTQYAYRRHIDGGHKFTGPMIAGAILSKWARDGLLYKIKLPYKSSRYPATQLYGYALTELGIHRLFFIEQKDRIY